MLMSYRFSSLADVEAQSMGAEPSAIMGPVGVESNVAPQIRQVRSVSEASKAWVESSLMGAVSEGLRGLMPSEEAGPVPRSRSYLVRKSNALMPSLSQS